jgi:signal transduction histidine kinase
MARGVKLWQKVSALCVCALLSVVIVCGALMLAHARDSILSMAVERGCTLQTHLTTSFAGMAQYYLEESASRVVKASGVKYCFERFAERSSVLVRGGETLYSSVTIAPEEYLAPESLESAWPAESGGAEPQYVLEEIQNRNVLILGSSVDLLGDVYAVYTVEDVSVVYNDIAMLTRRFALICAVSIAAGTALIVLLVRGATRPLVTLRNIARRIVAGEYGERADIRARDEVGELAADFNAMAEAVQSRIAELEDTIERRQLFIGGLTHELKTPMASMLLHTDTLLTADLNAEEAKGSLMHLYEQCRWLERLSQKLLRLITLDQEIQTQAVNMVELTDDVRDSVAESLRERNTPLLVECGADVASPEADYDLMKSLLINLIDNASKASEPGSVIRLRVSGGPDSGIIIEVADRGVGVSPEDIGRLTDPFYVADRSRSRKTGGSGLGLALVKRIADAHGAELVIDSVPAEGTTVRVALPVKISADCNAT